MANRPNHPIFWFFLLIFLFSGLMLGRLMLPFLSILVLAGVLTIAFAPFYQGVAGRGGRVLGSLSTCLLIFVILFIPLLLLVGALSKEAYDFYLIAKSSDFQNRIKALIENNFLLERANAWLAPYNLQLTGAEINQLISELGKTVGMFLYQQASAVASNLFKFFLNFFLMLIIIFFLLMDGHRFIAFVRDLSPLPEAQNQQLMQKFKDISMVILVVNGLSGLVQGTLAGLVFAAAGFKSAILWGVISGLAAFVPIVGIPVIFIPVAIYLMVIGQLGTGLLFVLFCLAVTITIDNIAKPKLVGDRVRIHPLLVFLSILGGISLFGALGIIYGPLIVTVFLTLTDIYHSSYQAVVESD